MAHSDNTPTEIENFPGGDLLPELVVSMSADRPWGDRFAELLSLERGWLSSEWNAMNTGEVISPETLVVAHRILSQCEERNWTLPRVYPTEEGGVQLEWGRVKWHSEIEIGLRLADDTTSVINMDLFDLYDVKTRSETSCEGADVEALEEFLEKVGPREL